MNKLTGFLAVSLLSFTAMAFGQQNTDQKNEITVPAKGVNTFSLQNQNKSGTGVGTDAYSNDYGYWTNFYVNIGSSGYYEELVTIYGLHFHYDYPPATIHCQPRQYDNYDHGYHDAYSCQVVSTGYDYVKVRVRRLDRYDYGWDNLRLDFVIYETPHL